MCPGASAAVFSPSLYPLCMYSIDHSSHLSYLPQASRASPAWSREVALVQSVDRGVGHVYEIVMESRW